MKNKAKLVPDYSTELESEFSIVELERRSQLIWKGDALSLRKAPESHGFVEASGEGAAAVGRERHAGNRGSVTF
jgi:hypothetical protein